MPPLGNRRICSSCKAEKCASCESLLRCPCKCNTNGFADILLKCVLTIVGLIMVILSMYLSMSSTKLISRLISSGLLSAGLSLTSIPKHERVHIDDVLVEFFFATLAGATSGAFIAGGEQMVITANSALRIVLLRALIGILVSFSSKSIELLKTRTNLWESFSILSFSAITGCMSGLTAYLGFAIGKHVTSMLVKSIVNILCSGLGASLSNTICQLIEIYFMKCRTSMDKKKLISSIKSNIGKRCFKESLNLFAMMYLTGQANKKTTVHSGRSSMGSEEVDRGENEAAAHMLMLSLI